MVVLQKLESSYDPATSLLGLCPKQLKEGSQRDICTLAFTAALLTIAKRWKQSKCPSVVEWINKIWYIHTKEYYSALKRKEILTYATTWMKLEDIFLSEINQSQRDKYCVILLI